MEGIKKVKNMKSSYCYLNYLYDSILFGVPDDEDEIKYNIRKYLNFPTPFIDRFYEFLFIESDQIKRKKKFMETSFVLFGSYNLDDKKTQIEIIFDIFKNFNENLIYVNEFILFLHHFTMNSYFQLKDKRFKNILPMNIRIRDLIEDCIGVKQALTLGEFQNCLIKKPAILESIEIIFCIHSPLDRGIINEIEKIIEENKFNKENFIVKKPKANQGFLQSIFNFFEEEEENNNEILYLNNSDNYNSDYFSSRIKILDLPNKKENSNLCKSSFFKEKEIILFEFNENYLTKFTLSNKKYRAMRLKLQKKLRLKNFIKIR